MRIKEWMINISQTVIILFVIVIYYSTDNISEILKKIFKRKYKWSYFKEDILLITTPMEFRYCYKYKKLQRLGKNKWVSMRNIPNNIQPKIDKIIENNISEVREQRIKEILND